MSHPIHSAADPSQLAIDLGVATIDWIKSELLTLDRIDTTVDRPLFRLALADLIERGETRYSSVVQTSDPLSISALELMLADAHMGLALTAPDRHEAASSISASTSLCASVLNRVTTKHSSGLSTTLLPSVVAILGRGQQAGLFSPEDQGSSLLLTTAEFLDASLEDRYVERLLAIEEITEAKLLLLTVADIDNARDRRLVLSEARRWCQEGALRASGAFDAYVTEEAESVISTIDATIDELTGPIRTPLQPL